MNKKFNLIIYLIINILLIIFLFLNIKKRDEIIWELQIINNDLKEQIYLMGVKEDGRNNN